MTVAATANKITETGFELHIISGDGTPIGSVGAAWAVFKEVSDSEQPVVKVHSYTSCIGSSVVRLEGKHTLLVHGRPGNVGLAAICAVDLKMEGGVWVDMELAIDRQPRRVKSDPIVWVKAGPENAIVYSIWVGFVLLKDVAF